MIKQIIKDYSNNVAFKKGDGFKWSPGQRTVYFNPRLLTTPEGIWSLLHELGHAILQHNSFSSDIELIKFEVEAWETAKELAVKYKLPPIDLEYIENNLDTYRNWIYRRSACPNCSQCSFQQDQVTYYCFNCNCVWRVPSSQICQVKRIKISPSPI